MYKVESGNPTSPNSILIIFFFFLFCFFICLIKMGSHYTFFTTTFLLMIYLGHVSLLLLTVICYFFNGCVVLQSVCYHDRFNQSSIDGHVGYTNIFAIINNAELNILIYLCALVESVVKYTSGMVGSIGLFLKKYYQVIFQKCTIKIIPLTRSR